MKLVSYLEGENCKQLGILVDGKVYNAQQYNALAPATMQALLANWDALMIECVTAENNIKTQAIDTSGQVIDNVNLLAPVPSPTSCRDAYAFRQHVAAARRNRGVPMIPEFDMYPIFYFTNHNAIQGPGIIECMPDHFQKLDFELELAVVINKKGRNITAAQADDYIGGFMIMNDMSARTLQMEEMLLNLGPAKGKDFSTVIGPMLVTPDELEPYKVECKANHVGNAYNLGMKCCVNGVQVSEGNVADMDLTFAEIIERCAYGADILAGDVIGSGTVGTGCFLELNGTGLLNNKDFKPQWLQDGDVVEMEIDMLGKLSNTIKKVNTDFSILALKKEPLV